MSLVNAETGEVIAEATPEQARERADRIRVALGVSWDLIVEAYRCRDWSALGHGSWDSYCSAEFGSARIRLPREERAEVVESLREQGLSIRAIASATGSDRNTVRNDLRQVGEFHPPDAGPQTLDEHPTGGWQPIPDRVADAAPDHLDDEISDEPEPDDRPEPPPITGTDGKTYPAKPATPPKPRRSPLPEAAQKAGWEFRKAAERLERIAADDRFPDNREQVTAALRGHLEYATEVLVDLLAQLDTDPTEDR